MNVSVRRRRSLEPSRNTRSARASRRRRRRCPPPPPRSRRSARCTRMFSSVMPGSTPQTAAGFRFGSNVDGELQVNLRRLAAVHHLRRRPGRPSCPEREPRHSRLVRSFTAAAPATASRSCLESPRTIRMAAGAVVLGASSSRRRCRAAMIERARRRDAVDEDRLAARTSRPAKSCRVPESDVDRVEVEPAGRRGRGAQHRMSRLAARRSSGQPATRGLPRTSETRRAAAGVRPASRRSGPDT